MPVLNMRVGYVRIIFETIFPVVIVPPSHPAVVGQQRRPDLRARGQVVNRVVRVGYDLNRRVTAGADHAGLCRCT